MINGVTEADTNASASLNADLATRKWSFEIPPEPIDESLIAETKRAQLVVVGEGLSGLSTALSASEEGTDTLIITASNGPVGRGGSTFAMYSKLMQAKGLPRQNLDNFILQEFASSSYNVDQRKWFKFINNSETVMDWLLDMLETDGIHISLENSNDDDPASPTYQPPGTHALYSDGGFKRVLDALEKRFIGLGGRVEHKIVAKRLIREGGGAGRVSAVIAQDSEGRFVKYIAEKAVVLATGDFSANRDMMAKYCPAYARHFSSGFTSYDVGFHEKGLYGGEGHLIALWAGAAWQRTFPNAPLIQGSRTCSNMPYGAHRGIRLNKNGERFMNEDANAPYTALAVLREPDETAYVLWGTDYAYDVKWVPNASMRGTSSIAPEKVIEMWEADAAKGVFVKGDTIAEVVEKLRLPKEKAIAEVERYNDHCRSGADPDFHKKAKYLQEIKGSPFYGASIGQYRFFSILGGPRTNHNMQICDEKDKPLGGLYAAGSLIGDLYANCYNFRIAGHNYGNCLTLGYLTGKYISKFE